MNNFSSNLERNANLQSRKLTRAIDIYCQNIVQKNKKIRYVRKNKGFGMMQPMALKNFSEVAVKHLEPVIGTENISMFTIVVDKYNFGKDNWHFDYEAFRKEIKKILKGYDYMANVALDEFPRERYEYDGILMTPHIHGIFFTPLTRWEKSQLSIKIKKHFPEYRIRPFVVREKFDLESAVQYSFKALYGAKISYIRRDSKSIIKPMNPLYKNLYINFRHLRPLKIYDCAFAGGAGKKILRNIISDIKKR